MPELSQDRREFFRILDTLAMDFQPVADAISPDDPCFPYVRSTSVFQLVDKLQQSFIEGKTLLRQINDENRRVASYLKNIDRRINHLSSIFLAGNPEVLALGHYPASLSEGGLSFITEEPIGAGQHLALKILLMPEYCGLFACARCLSSRQHPKGWENALTFTNITENDQQLLARHIIKAQAHERRQQLKMDAQDSGLEDA